MNQTVSRLTLAVAAVVFVGGTAYGVKLATAPADTGPTGPTCQTRSVPAGEDVTPNLITVNVYNSSQRSGLANRVNIDLQRKGFLGGKIGNASDLGDIRTKTVTIVTDDKMKSEIRLVAGQFKDEVQYAAPQQALGSGVTVIIGDDYSGLKKKGTRIVDADRDMQFCLPIVPIT